MTLSPIKGVELSFDPKSQVEFVELDWLDHCDGALPLKQRFGFVEGNDICVPKNGVGTQTVNDFLFKTKEQLQ